MKQFLPLVLAGSLLMSDAASAAAPVDSPLLDQARRAFQAGDREEAIRIATKMIAAEPNSATGFYLKPLLDKPREEMKTVKRVAKRIKESATLDV